MLYVKLVENPHHFCKKYFNAECEKVYKKNNILLHFSIDHPEVTLSSVHDYGLCIAEDDGEVDWAFPCLDANEPCSKFGFTCLGLILIEQKKNSYASEPLPMPEDGILSSGDFHNMLHKSSGSHQNPSRNYTDGSATSEAVLSAMKAVNEGIIYHNILAVGNLWKN